MLTDKKTVLRTAAELTTEYAESESAQVGNSSRISVYLDFTLADLTSLELCVEWSPDRVAWRVEPTLSPSSGVVTIYPATFTALPAQWGVTATGTRIVFEVADAHVRVKVKGTGTVAGSSCGVTISEANAD